MHPSVLIPALILALIVTTALSGCAGGLGGQKRYACEGLPSRPLCLSTSEVYALTNHAGPPPAERLARQEKNR
ncbi:conjugal transfer protein TraV [Thiohalocapsa marina]|uniref:conjugal transfer protein TraV n=1 Tax=Thiohalocapsa marina TaxID=424902 RepID=UPI0036DF4EF3